MVKPEEVKGDDEKQGVPEKSESGHRVFAPRGEATTGHIEPPGEVESERPEKDSKQADENENATPNPESEGEAYTGDQLQPGYPKGDDIYRYLGKKLIIVNRSGEKFRVDDLIQAGNDEDAAEDDPGPKGEAGMGQQGDYTGPALRRCHGHLVPWIVRLLPNRGPG
jgi:hypothetical protein